VEGVSKAYTREAAISSRLSSRRSKRDPRAKQGFGWGVKTCHCAHDE